MATRERDDQPQGFADVPESLAAVEPPAPLSAKALAASAKRLEQFEALLAELPQADEARRLELARGLNEVLVAMRAPGHEKEESLLVRSALEGKALTGLVDVLGHSCRKEAVETLLACGYPWALEVPPEDLEFARNFSGDAWTAGDSWAKAMRDSRTAAAQVMSLGAVAHLIFLLGGDKLGAPAGMVSAALGVAGAAVLWALRRTDPRVLTRPAYLGVNGAFMLGLLAALPWTGGWGAIAPLAAAAVATLTNDRERGGGR